MSQKNVAVIETGGKQYIVSEGDVISIEKLNIDVDSDVTLDNVLLINNKKETLVGMPKLNFIVKAKVLNHEKDKKVRVFKFKKKTGFRKTQGHRQNYTTIKILTIEKLKNKSKEKAEIKA